ncbi:hypothetical protein NHJ6243_010207, partial [Beauveria neobassiana]
MALLGLVFAGVYSVLCIIRTYHSITETKYGLGLPLALRPPQNIVTYLEVNYAGRPIYQIGISFFKIALLIGYLRLLQGTSNKAYRGAIWCTIAFVSVSHVGSAMSFVALRLSAGKIEKSWKPGRPGTCLPVDASFTVYSILTIVSDVIVAVL